MSYPHFVDIDGTDLWMGNEMHASNIRVLRELNITRVLNLGVPQCLNFFEQDPYIRYEGVELFDNKESNFTNVFLNQCYPFMTQAIEEGKGKFV